MKRFVALCTAILMGLVSPAGQADQGSNYFNNKGRSDVLAGGVRMIPITTPSGTFKVWTKRVGNNPTIKVLLLHGGPGATHEYFEAFDSYFPGASIEYYYYDQLGSSYSDQPDQPALWELPRFVEEVEQVRIALGLNSSNFYVLGHSWGGILAAEYALKYGKNLKGMIISNMMMSIPAYNAYADKVLMPAMDQKALATILQMEKDQQTSDPRYMELLGPYYESHILRKPQAQWPEPVTRSFAKINPKVYVPLQGPSEMGSHDSKLEHWDRVADLPKISVPTLVIAGAHDTMEPAHMKMVAARLKRGRYLLCPEGGHLAMYDDQQVYFTGLIRFLKDVDSGKF
ncbi:proline iminopeptidase-family hydrolase [Massilia sp. DWR3-1-1]|uniref:proline iminopeptidase-family hydrolase n=1 Tax=Massilia sp. DWR3-1-1 TaxID=2804559 RepID=UPI003CF23257